MPSAMDRFPLRQSPVVMLVSDDGAVVAVRKLRGVGIHERDWRGVCLQVDPMDEVRRGLKNKVVTWDARATHCKLTVGQVRGGELQRWRMQPEEALRTRRQVVGVGAGGARQVSIRP